jgi:hypothetical protein
MILTEELIKTNKKILREKRDELTRGIKHCLRAADRACNKGFKEFWLNLAADLERTRRSFYPIGAQVLKGKKK